MTQLIVIDRSNDESEQPDTITLPDGALALGHAAGLAWYRLPHGALAPAGSRVPTPAEVDQARLSLPAVLSLKASVRRRIEADVGGVHELIADQAKQIEALTALTARLAVEHFGGQAVSEEDRANYLARWQAVIDALDSGDVTMRSDEEPAGDMIMRVLSRSSRINKIIADEYLPRRDALLQE